MSVVLYRRTSSHIELAADTYGYLESTGLSNTDSKKLFKFEKFAIGHVGSKSFAQYCNEKMLAFINIKFTVVELRHIFQKILEEYNGDIDHRCIIAGGGKGFRITIDNNKLISCEEITSDISGIGLYEMPIGAVLAGKSLVDAIRLCAERNAYFGGDVSYVEIEL